MARFGTTKYAGQRAEQMVKDVLARYTRHVHTNVRVDTLFTKNGTTEIDIVAAVADVLLVVEVKNISAIEGTVGSTTWVMYGAERREPYTALNVFTQNRIHVRSFKDAWFVNRAEFPPVISVVVVPNGCQIPEDISANGVLTVSEFSVQVAELCMESTRAKYGYALDYEMGKNNGYFAREDFVGGV